MGSVTPIKTANNTFYMYMRYGDIEVIACAETAEACREAFEKELDILESGSVNEANYG